MFFCSPTIPKRGYLIDYIVGHQSANPFCVSIIGKPVAELLFSNACH